MRHKIFTIITLTLVALSVSAQTDFDGLKFFVNPGHGGHDSDDRYMKWAEFYESDANLSKGLYLRQLFEDRNAEVFMSRTTNFTEDDLALSTISAMANEADVDFFLSIHSNGANGQVNRPLMLYRGYTSDPVFDEAKDMSAIMITRLFEQGDCWTNENDWIAGDWTFYSWGTSGLGVLRNLTMPGVLSEGSFHDYVAETWRLKNNAYLMHEAWTFLRSFTEFYSVATEETGIIAGVVRNPMETPDYYFKPGTNDEFMPINKAIVTLTPGDRTYLVDTLNNGYFMFDSVAPGDYKLYFDGVENFYRDSATVIVTADHSVLINKTMQIDTMMVPTIRDFLPLMSEDSIALDQTFVLSFDLNMNPDSVEKAFIVEPAAEMVFVWDEQFKTVSVKSKHALGFKTDYSVKLTTTACSRWGVHIANDIAQEYVTLNHTKLEIVKAYPRNSQVGVSQYPQMRVIFNAPVSVDALTDNFRFTDIDGNKLEIVRMETSVVAGQGIFVFEAAQALKNRGVYLSEFDAELTDDYGVTLGEEKIVRFSVVYDPPEQGEVVTNYDDISSFWDPNGSGSTQGTDDPSTVFTQSTDRKMGGSGSGRLDYTFTNNIGGICRVYDSAKPKLPSDTEKFGVWVFGDQSMNLLEYWFYVDDTNVIVPVDQLDWAGWEYKSVAKSAIGNGTIKFHSVLIIQTAEGTKQSVVYFDEAQVVTPSGGVGFANLQSTVNTLSVYPNPAKEQVFIKFNLTEEANVSVSVLSITGKALAQVYRANRVKGEHTTMWIPNLDSPEGLYFIRLETTNTNGQKTVKYTKCILNK